jgi:hypothetical protein
VVRNSGREERGVLLHMSETTAAQSAMGLRSTTLQVLVAPLQTLPLPPVLLLPSGRRQPGYLYGHIHYYHYHHPYTTAFPCYFLFQHGWEV